jgi:F-type H+-transporting ATPase subunit delta
MEEIASVYARSLFEVAQEQGKLDDVREQLGEFADALDSNQEMQVFFFSPYFSTPEKEDGLAKVVSDAEPIVENFLLLLIEKHRMPTVFAVRRVFDELWRQENKLLPVEITSAIELDQSTVKQIGDRIGEETGQKIDLSERVDPDILGGLVVRVGNSIIDASIRSRLDSLRKQVAKA